MTALPPAETVVLSALETPAAIIDLDRVQKNLERATRGSMDWHCALTLRHTNRRDWEKPRSSGEHRG